MHSNYISFLLVFSGPRLVLIVPYFQMDINSDTYSPSPGTSSESARVPDDFSTVRKPVAGAKTLPQVSA